MLDPNVLVSGAISSGGTTAMIVDLIEAAVLIPIVSPALLGELRSVLERDKFRRYLSLQAAMEYVEKLERTGQRADDPPKPARVSPDPNDDYLIAVARSTKADALVSGDRDLTDLRLPDLVLLTPRQLLEMLDR